MYKVFKGPRFTAREETKDLSRRWSPTFGSRVEIAKGFTLFVGTGEKVGAEATY